MKDHKWDSYFLKMANQAASMSKDPSTKVGCVIVDTKRRVLGVGYNGFPRGVLDDQSRLEDRATKYLLTLHAEVNAVIQSSTSLQDAIAYVTHPPCAQCTGVLIQAGIRKIVAYAAPLGLLERFQVHYDWSDLMRKEAGVELDLYPREET